MANSLELSDEKLVSCKLNNIAELWKNEEYCDFTIISNDQQFDIHKLVLASCSSYFKTLFSESETNEVVLDDIRPEIIKYILDYCYTSIIKLDSCCDLEELFKVANRFGMDGLENLCVKSMSKNLDPTDCNELLESLDQLERDVLLPSVIEFYEDNFETLMKNDRFLEWDEEIFGSLISSDGLKVSSEKIVFDSILDWYLFKDDRGTDAFQRLIDDIRYVGFNDDDFVYMLLENEWEAVGSVEQEIKKFIKSAIKYRSSELTDELLAEKEEKPWRFTERSPR